MNWLEALATIAPEVSLFMAQNNDFDPDNYQVKWEVLRSILMRRPAGVIRHLPSKRVTPFTSNV